MTHTEFWEKLAENNFVFKYTKKIGNQARSHVVDVFSYEGRLVGVEIKSNAYVTIPLSKGVAVESGRVKENEFHPTRGENGAFRPYISEFEGSRNDVPYAIFNSLWNSEVVAS